MVHRFSRLLLNFFVNGVLVLGSVVVCFLAIELFLWSYSTLYSASPSPASGLAGPPAADSGDEIIVPADIQAKASRLQALLSLPDEWKLTPVTIPGADKAYTWHGSLHVINQFEMRWAAPFPEKRVDVYRVLVVGDSLTYGWGIAEPGTFTALLNEWLGRDYRIEFLNLGMPGAQSEDILKNIKKFVPQLKPDLVIYAVCLNDFLPSGQGQYNYVYPFPIPEAMQRFFMQHTRTGVLLSELYDQTLRRFHLRRDFFDDILRGFGGYEERFRRDVAEMNSYVKSAGLPSLIAMVVDQDPNYTGRHHNIVLTAEDALRRAEIDTIPTENYYRRYHGKPMFVSRWEGHPNEVANYIWATMFLRKLQTRADIQAYKK